MVLFLSGPMRLYGSITFRQNKLGRSNVVTGYPAERGRTNVKGGLALVSPDFVDRFFKRNNSKGS